MIRTVAVIGCGKAVEGKEGWAIGHAHARGWLAADSGIRLLGVDISEENLRAFSKTFNLPDENLFRSTKDLYAAVVPDFVSVCTWPGLHFPQVVEAIEHGVKGIACEKPAALTPAETNEMVRKCEEAGVRLVIGHQRRLSPNFQLLKKLLHQGQIGRPWMLEARVADGWDIMSWTTHWFDMANFLFEARPLSVLAGLQHSGVRRYHHAVEDESVIFASYPEGNQAVFITGPEKPLAPWISIRGSEGFLTTGIAPNGPVEVFSRGGFASHEPVGNETDAFGPMLQELIGAVENGGAMTCAAHETIVATEMAFAAHESARTLRRVNLPVDFQYAPLEILQHPSHARLPAGEILLYADHHFGSGGREGLAAALRDISGREITAVDADACALTREHLKDARVLVFYHTQKEASEETRAALKDWVEARRPLLLVHAAIGAYSDWEDYTKWCGRVWVWKKSQHPHEESKLLGRADWPWSEAWLPRDEGFIKLGTTAPVIDLVDVELSDGRYPAAWISRDFANIGVWVPGHRNDLWRIPAMREGLGEMIRRISF